MAVRGWSVRRLGVPAPAWDVGLATACAALVLVQLMSTPAGVGQRPSDTAAVVLTLTAALAYVLHRRAPLPALAIGLGAVVTYSLAHYTAYPGYAPFLFAWGIAAHGTRRTSVVAFLAVLAALVVSLAVQPSDVADVSAWTSTLLAAAVAWLAGENRRTARGTEAALRERAALLEERTGLLEERTALLARDREQVQRQAVVSERLRLARELHDVVSHSMSVVAVQSGMANLVLDTRPDKAREALAAIEVTSRSALVEMRRLLGVLRQEDDAATLAPAPGLADVPELLDSVRRTGLQVELDVEGTPRTLPPAVDLTAYRLVQEALTNVVKHGGPVARVRIHHGEDLAIEVSDDGTAGDRQGPTPPSPGGGHGLTGMQERVAAFGGRLVADERPDGGFRVLAELPLREAVR